MNTQNKEIRFGTLAVEKGFVAAGQVVDALGIQLKENILLGKHRRIGMILFDQGLMTLSQIDEVLQELEERRTGDKKDL